jgi:ABC-type Mn2+/Zn2+ transport system permease subunit
VIDLLLWPLVNGLLVASLLALAGVALFLRGSGWQALASCQSAAAGGVVASTMGLAVTPVALLAALVALGVMRRAGPGGDARSSGDPARMPLAVFLLATALTSLLAANLAAASLAAARWVEGEILFAVASDVVWAFGLAVLTLAALPKLTGRWLAEQCEPDCSAQASAAGVRTKRLGQGLDLMWMTLVLVLGARTLGVPAALAVLLFPAWAAARTASSFRGLLISSQLLALAAMVAAWAPTVLWDQPFAPSLVLANAALAAVVVLASFTRRGLS